MKKQINDDIVDYPILSSLNVIYIHKARKFTDIYQEFEGKYHQISFKIKRQRGRFPKQKKLIFEETERYNEYEFTPLV